MDVRLVFSRANFSWELKGNRAPFLGAMSRQIQVHVFVQVLLAFGTSAEKQFGRARIGLQHGLDHPFKSQHAKISAEPRDAHRCMYLAHIP